MSDLRERVDKFNCMELPGQPMGMHIGTGNLVNDLWRESAKLRAALEWVEQNSNEPDIAGYAGRAAALEKP